WKARVRAAWPNVSVEHVESGGVAEVPQVGDELHLRAHIGLGELSAEDVAVEVVYGRSTGGDELSDVERLELRAEPDEESTADGAATRLFTGTVQLGRAGGFGYTVRVVPAHPLLSGAAEMGLVAVAE
ncbi:MAG TPA: DUF3417 domain-containing protein, partial [Microterricola sp.]